MALCAAAVFTRSGLDRWLRRALADTRVTNGWSIPGGSPDRVEVLENVYAERPADGMYTITVEAWNLPGDSVPVSGSVTDQDFALVVSNAVLVSG